MSDNSSLTPDNVARMVMLVYGQMSDGKPFWCYVAVKPSRYDELRKLVADKKLDLRTYEDDGLGEIVVSGEGVTPPQDVTKKVAGMFNVPIKDLMKDIDPKAAIADEIERLKKQGH